jgi:hypothetical protein
VRCSACNNVELFVKGPQREPEPQFLQVVGERRPYAPPAIATWRPSVKGILESLLAVFFLSIAAAVVYWLGERLNGVKNDGAAGARPPPAADGDANGRP